MKGELFGHDFQRKSDWFYKSIVPTKTIFQVGLHQHSCCRLDHWQMNGCSNKNDSTIEFCNHNIAIDNMHVNLKYMASNMTYHTFDQVILPSDRKTLNKVTEGLILHIKIFRPEVMRTNLSVNGIINNYAKYFFPKVLKNLRNRNIDLLIDVPVIPEPEYENL